MNQQSILMCEWPYSAWPTLLHALENLGENEGCSVGISWCLIVTWSGYNRINHGHEVTFLKHRSLEWKWRELWVIFNNALVNESDLRLEEISTLSNLSKICTVSGCRTQVHDSTTWADVIPLLLTFKFKVDHSFKNTASNEGAASFSRQKLKRLHRLLVYVCIRLGCQKPKTEMVRFRFTCMVSVMGDLVQLLHLCTLSHQHLV